MSLEEEFGVEFSPEEISELDSVGAIKAKLVHTEWLERWR